MFAIFVYEMNEKKEFSQVKGTIGTMYGSHEYLVSMETVYLHLLLPEIMTLVCRDFRVDVDPINLGSG